MEKECQKCFSFLLRAGLLAGAIFLLFPVQPVSATHITISGTVYTDEGNHEPGSIRAPSSARGIRGDCIAGGL